MPKGLRRAVGIAIYVLVTVAISVQLLIGCSGGLA